MGNRLTEVLVNGSNTTSTTDTYDARDRLTGESVTTNGSPASTTTDTYDSNGSLVQSQITIGTQTTTNTYSYDARGRLLTAQINGQTVTYSYDNDGNKISETAGALVTMYTIDEDNPAGYSQVLEERTGTTTNPPTASSPVTISYAIGNSVFAQSGFFANASAQGMSGTGYFLTDGHGSTRELFLPDGSQEVYNYDAFGNLLSNSSQYASTSYLYSGEHFDSALGEYYWAFRPYSPEQGRFEMADNIANSPGDLTNRNPYVYAADDVVNGIDPSGHEFEMIAPILEWSAAAFRSVLTTARGFQASWGMGRDVVNSLDFDTSDPFELAQLSQLSEQLQMQDVESEARRGAAAVDYSELVDWQAIDATFDLNETILLDLVTAFSFAQACFAAGTPVVVGGNSDGSYATKPIEDVRAGDEVLARDERNALSDALLRRVEEVFSREADSLRVLTVRDGQGQQATIRTTDGHLIWVAGRGWSKAAKLEAGDRLCDAHGNESVVVLSTERQELAQPVRVYTFRVESDHTYFVSDAVGMGWLTAWVHNVCGGAKALEETLQEEKGVAGQSQADREFSVNGRNRIADAVFEGPSGPAAGEAKYVRNWKRSIYNPKSPIGSKSFATKVRSGLVDQAKDYLSEFKTVEYYSNSREFIETYSRQFEESGIDMRRVKFTYRP